MKYYFFQETEKAMVSNKPKDFKDKAIYTKLLNAFGEGRPSLTPAVISPIPLHRLG